MKKISQSIEVLPHIGVNTTDIAADKIAFRNNLSDSQKKLNEQQIFDAVRQIVDKYREVQEKDLTERNKYLILYIVDNFQKILKPYVDDFSKTVGLTQIIEDAVQSRKGKQKEEIKDVTDTILGIVSKAIKKLQISSGKYTSVDSHNIEVLPLEDERGLDYVFNKLHDMSEFRKLKKNMEEQFRKHSERLAEAFKTQKNGIHYHDNITGLDDEGIQKLKDENVKVVKEHFKNIKLEKSDKEIKDNPLQQLIQLVSLRVKTVKDKVVKFTAPLSEFLNGTFGIFSTVFGFTGKYILGPIVTAVKSTAGVLMKGITKIGKGFVTVAKFLRLDKLFGKLKNAIVSIFTFTKKALKNTFLAFLMTPMGMYTMGFILGFMWKKIENKITDLFSKDEYGQTRLEKTFKQV